MITLTSTQVIQHHLPDGVCNSVLKNYEINTLKITKLRHFKINVFGLIRVSSIEIKKHLIVVQEPFVLRSLKLLNLFEDILHLDIKLSFQATLV